jgi:PAS domain S-box-containing protein
VSLTIITSFLLRFIAIIWSIVLIKQTKDWRMGFLTIVLVLMAMCQMITLWTAHESGVLLMKLNLAEIPSLFVSILMLFSVFFLKQLLSKKNQVENALKLSETKFHLIFEQAAIGVALIESKTGKIVQINQHYCDIIGYSIEEMTDGKTFKDITHPDDLQACMEQLEKLLSGSIREFTTEKRYCHKDGSIIWVRLMIASSWKPDKEPDYHIAAVQDITEQKEVENELQQYEEQLRKLVFEIIIAEEKERRRIAVDLHDYIIQDLGLCKIKLGELSKALPEDNLLPLAEEVRELIQKSITQSRSLVFELSLPILYELGFEAAIKWLSEQTTEKTRFVCNVHDDGQIKPMRKEMQVLLFKAVRELLTNVEKHAEATEVNIYINKNQGNIEIIVEDNGKGFDFDPSQFRNGKILTFGLFGIKERLSLLNGSVTIDSSHAYGTKVTLSAPLEPVEETDSKEEIEHA